MNMPTYIQTVLLSTAFEGEKVLGAYFSRYTAKSKAEDEAKKIEEAGDGRADQTIWVVEFDGETGEETEREQVMCKKQRTEFAAFLQSLVIDR